MSFPFFQIFLFVQVELSWKFFYLLFSLSKATVTLAEELVQVEAGRSNTVQMPELKVQTYTYGKLDFFSQSQALSLFQYKLLPIPMQELSPLFLTCIVIQNCYF